MNIYLALSVTERHQPMVPLLSSLASHCGVQVTVGPRPWDPQHLMPESVPEALLAADCYLGFFLKGGPHLYYANMEGSFIRNNCQDKPVAILFEKGVLPPACFLNLQGRMNMEFHAGEPGPIVTGFRHEIGRFRDKLDERQLASLYGFGISLLSAAAFITMSADPSFALGAPAGKGGQP